MKTILYVATSIDGYISDINGGVSFLDKYNDVDCQFETFLNPITKLVLGNRTYKEFGIKAYKNKPCFVFSKTKQESKEVTYVQTIDEFYNQCNKDDIIWIVGGSNIATLFSEYIDEFIITIIPEILGEGIPLLTEKKSLKLLETKTFEKGILQLTYSPISI